MKSALAADALEFQLLHRLKPVLLQAAPLYNRTLWQLQVL